MPQPLKTSGRDAKRYAANLTPDAPRKPTDAPLTPGRYRLVKGLGELGSFLLVGTLCTVTLDCPVRGLVFVMCEGVSGDIRAAFHEKVIRAHFERVGA